MRRRYLIKVLQRDGSQLLSHLAQAGVSPKSWVQQIQVQSQLYIEPVNGALDFLKNNLPRHVDQTIADADRIITHEFDLLGSGPYVPADPDRSQWDNGYQPIDWYLDPVSSLRFPQGVLYTDWDLFKMRPGLADIKLPWELSRCQHWPLLGQAYRLTSNEKYASEIAHQLDDFMEANPVGIGINWTCTMDVAIRALNWAMGLQLIRSSKAVDDDFWLRAYGALYSHGQFIRHNLENVNEVTNNHYLSNIVGLFALGAVFRELPEGQDWLSFCRKSLEEEINTQVLNDGADFESSIPYHRLVTEMFLSAARQADHIGEPLSQAFISRLNAMMDFMHGVLRPDGLMPQCGDADDGRLHIFTHYGDWEEQDPRHIFAPAASTLGCPELLRHAGEDGLWEATWWGFDPASLDVSDEPLPSNSQLYPEAGHAVFREGGAYLILSNGVVGTEGFGNHKHNDQLSFEFHAGNTPLIVDPGSYVYTSDPDSRNQFRGTGYHNTLKIDGVEQNEMNPEWFFRMFDSGTPEHLNYSDEGDIFEYHGRHIGYRRLKQPVTHERHFRLLKKENALLIADVLKGSGLHTLGWHFHCAPGVDVAPSEQGHFKLESRGQQFVLASVDHIPGKPGEGWYSPSYGKKEPCSVVDFSLEASISGSSMWLFMITPVKWAETASNQRKISDFRDAVGSMMP